MNQEDKILRENLFNKKELLLENSSPNELADAIKKHQVLYIYYAGDNTIRKGYRTVEPYLLGIAKGTGNTLLRAWQQSGDSDSFNSIGRNRRPGKDDIPGWRLFNINFITSVSTTDKVFSTEANKIRPKYNPNDKQMERVLFSVQQGGNVDDKSVFDNQEDLFKSSFDMSKNSATYQMQIYNLYQMMTRQRKKRADNYIVVNKKDPNTNKVYLWVDTVKNSGKYREKDVHGNLKDLFKKFSGLERGKKDFFNKHQEFTKKFNDNNKSDNFFNSERKKFQTGM